MDTKVAKRYARALFAAGLKENMLISIEDDLNAIARILTGDEKFRRFLLTPEQPREDKLGLIERVFSDRITSLTMSMLRLLLAKRREDEFELVRLEFARLRREHDRVIKALITSAFELNASEKDAIIAKLASSTGKTVEPEYFVDPKMIGGVKVAYDNYVLDGTVRGSLDRLKETLVYDLLKQI